MDNERFIHPGRLQKNVDGPFYTTGECLFCGIPEAEAPDLLAELNDDNLETYFVRQPKNADEVERAAKAIEACCFSTLRYGGEDDSIIDRLGNDPAVCDYVVSDGKVELAVGVNGELTDLGIAAVEAIKERLEGQVVRLGNNA